ncbi:Bicoid-interacting protein 3-domain-containing protein [Mycotypha africana]|uniref:Bicoid-interacting protein 3-domain-containing protein n=1 Tax=Mycotypha africana TaxID=64632 RepID=UPI00230090C2|nr:Bicoid-interacting protein 3-domain-containing protein [Mycotypha africana]KAI8984703.1 Bicoid-interacting protein 3-domain-containing protein [Mycotypha africana]
MNDGTDQSTRSFSTRGQRAKIIRRPPRFGSNMRYNGGRNSNAKMKTNERKEDKKNTFGSFPYGNYPAYYTQRRKQGNAVIDPRIDLVDASVFKHKRILDIGCNSGNLTIAIAKMYDIISIHGVDIDEGLISKANKNARVAYSLQNPHETNDINTTTMPFDLSLRFHYFPQSMTNMFGMLPMTLPPNCPKPKGFPYNVTFETMDWTTADVEKETYDTVLALSITKWIHLHRGDEGLKAFFQKIHDTLKPGGTLVLEPQEFETYQKKAKLIDPSTKVEDELHFRPEEYTDYLINTVGFREHHDLGVPQSESKGFSRPVILYIK